MEEITKFIADNGPQLLQWTVTLAVGAGGGWGAFRLAAKRHRRVMSNLRRPVMIIGTTDTDLTDQQRLLRAVDLFDVSDVHRGEKAIDFISAEHRLLILGYSDSPLFPRAFECARSKQIPVLVYAKPGAVPNAQMSKICGYSFASICNTDLRLVSDVFALMSTFPEKL